MGQLTSGTCATNLGTAAPEYQGLTDGACDKTGCTCSAQVNCRTTEVLYTSGTTCSGANVTVTLDPPAYNTAGGPCVPVTSQFYTGSSSNKVTSPASQTCANTGAATLPPPTWTASSKFCPVVAKGSCPTAGYVCVPKISTGQFCVQLPTASAQCPASYTTTSGNWYSSYAAGTCSCGCTLDTAQCVGQTEVQYYSDSVCGNFFGYNTGTGCSTGCCTGLYYGGALAFSASKIGSVRAYISATGSGTCSVLTSKIASQATGSSTICCQ